MVHNPFPRRQDPREQAFVERAIAECLEAGVAVYAYLKPNIGTKKQPISGSYNTSPDGRRSISVATKRRNWLATFAHEFNHFRQDRERTRWFADRRIDRMWYTFDDWIEGRIESTPSRIEECVREIQLCELDCERRTLRTIDEEGLSSIDPEAYARGSNAYVWSYEACRLFRAWNGPGSMSPTRNRILQAKCPPRLMRPNQVHRPPKGYLAAYAQQCMAPA